MSTKQTRGERFAEVVTEALELEAHESELLTQIARTLDLLDELDAEIKAGGMLLPDGKVRPCVIESRLQSVTLSRLLASLRLPDDLANPETSRGQRRGGARGTYVPRDELARLRSARNA